MWSCGLLVTPLPGLAILLLLPCCVDAVSSLLTSPPAWSAKTSALLQRRSEDRLAGSVVEDALTGTEGEEMATGTATLLSEYFKHVIEHAGSLEAWAAADVRRFQSLALLHGEELDQACAEFIPKKKVRHQVAGMVRNTVHRQAEMAKQLEAEESKYMMKEVKQLKAMIEQQAPFLRQWDMYDHYVRGSMPIVLSWPILPAAPESTDRVAVAILLEGIKGRYVQHNAQYVIRSVMHRLGPRWALHIFHGNERRYSLEKSLGFPGNVTWTLATVDGKPVPLSHEWNSQVRWSRDFYNAIPQHHEHILIFELDSLLLRSNCVENFFDYDLVGAPGRHPPFPEGWLNGGFTLRRRSTFWRAVNLYNYSEARHLAHGDNPDEDNIATIVLNKMGAKIAPDEVAKNFSFESIPNSTACAFHKPWAYSDMYDSMRVALAEAVL